jgi:alpha-L-fucosidase
MSLCNQWSWKPNDEMKSLEKCLRTLIACAAGDGNLLLNVGPMSSGEIEPRQVRRLKEIGKWLSAYGQTIYGTRGGPYRPSKNLASTRRGNIVYVHVFNWQAGSINLPKLPRKVISSRLVTGGEVVVKQTDESLTLTVPKPHQNALDTIVELGLDGPALSITPIRLP